MLPVVNETTCYWLMPFNIDTKIRPCPKYFLKLELPEALLILNIYASLDALARHAYSHLSNKHGVHAYRF